MPSVDIIIKKGETGQGASPQVTEQVKEKEQGKPSIQNQAVNNAIINSVKQVGIQGFQQYGNLTGDYAAVEAFDTTLSIIADVAILATGPVGIIAVGTKQLLSIGGSFVKQYNSDKETALLIERSGNLALKGSRYSYD